MGLNTQQSLKVPTTEEVLKDMICECDEKTTTKKPDGTQKSCRALGTDKHKCMDREIDKHNLAQKEPRIGNEVGFDMKETPLDKMPSDPKIEAIFKEYKIADPTPPGFQMLPFTRTEALAKGKLRGSFWPDACSLDQNGDPYKLYDFKFKCPKSKYKGQPKWGKGQEKKYTNATLAADNDPKKDPNCAPEKLDNRDCDSFKKAGGN